MIHTLQSIWPFDFFFLSSLVSLRLLAMYPTIDCGEPAAFVKFKPHHYACCTYLTWTYTWTLCAWTCPLCWETFSSQVSNYFWTLTVWALCVKWVISQSLICFHTAVNVLKLKQTWHFSSNIAAAQSQKNKKECNCPNSYSLGCISYRKLQASEC